MAVKGTNIKDVLISKVAEDLQQPEKVVETVVNHQFQNAFKAMGGDNRQVEISGFGTFEQSVPKIKRRITRLEKIKTALLNNIDIAAHQEKMTTVTRSLENLYNRI